MEENRAGHRHTRKLGEHDDTEIALHEMPRNVAEEFEWLGGEPMTPAGAAMELIEFDHRLQTAFHGDFDAAGFRLANGASHGAIEISKK